MTSELQRAELEEQREFLLKSLRDLEREREAGDIATNDYEKLRNDYIARAAAVLRALDEDGDQAAADDAAVEPGGDSDPDEPGPAPNRRRLMATVASVLIVALIAGGGVLFFAGERDDSQSSESMTAGTPAERLMLASQLDAEGKALDALKLYDSVIEDEPGNVEALTYRGWLLARANLADRALESLDRAIAIEPTYPDPHFFRGIVLYRLRNDPAAAIPEFETFLASNPPPAVVPEVQAVLERARQEVTTGTSAPPPSVPPAPPGG